MIKAPDLAKERAILAQPWRADPHWSAASDQLASRIDAGRRLALWEAFDGRTITDNHGGIIAHEDGSYTEWRRRA